MTSKVYACFLALSQRETLSHDSANFVTIASDESCARLHRNDNPNTARAFGSREAWNSQSRWCIGLPVIQQWAF